LDDVIPIEALQRGMRNRTPLTGVTEYTGDAFPASSVTFVREWVRMRG